MRGQPGFKLTLYGHCALAGCRAPLFVELMRCGDLSCFHNLICFECAELVYEVAEELAREGRP